MKYFKEEEFACKCHKCGKGYANMDKELLTKLDKAREIAGVAFNLTSAFRCAAHNKAVGGVVDSAHTTGKAVDIAWADETVLLKILKGVYEAGFIRVGLNLKSKFIHVDVDMDKPHPAYFKY